MELTIHSGAELIMQYYPEIINQVKIDDGFTPLHVTAHADNCDTLCYLAAMVSIKIIYSKLVHRAHNLYWRTCKNSQDASFTNDNYENRFFVYLYVLCESQHLLVLLYTDFCLCYFGVCIIPRTPVIWTAQHMKSLHHC